MGPPVPAPTRRVTAGGIDLALLEAGIGGRPLLAVHGFTGAKEDFVDFLVPLAERGWHAVAVDLRGHGESDAPVGEQHYSFDILAGEVLAVVDALGWASCALLGHSMGGILAQRVALDHPERVDALILLDTFCGPVGGVEMALVEFGAAVVRQSGMTGLAQALAVHRGQNPEPGVAAQDMERVRPGYRRYVESKLLNTAPDLWVALAPAFLTLAPWTERLGNIEMATAVIVGEHDRASWADSHSMAASIPGAQLAVIAGAGHSPQFEAPDAWWEALTSFLDRLGPQSPGP